MENSLFSRIKRGWNAFRNPMPISYDEGYSSYYRPDMPRLSKGNERTIITSVYNRIALDAAAIDIKHVRVDSDGRFTEDIDSDLNNCLTLESNIDQTARYFKQDLFLTMLENGHAAIVPVSTDNNPRFDSSYHIYSMRVGTVTQWRPTSVRVRLYNELNGEFGEVDLPKELVCLVSNPFYAVMNEPNSVMQRLIRKLKLLDAIDEQSGSGKLDLIIQLPFLVKGERKKQEANQRRKEIEEQLRGSKYGIAYIDGTEHITQLNRAVENNLMSQIEWLTNQLYSQLGLTQALLDGTAKEEEFLKYEKRVLEPILSYVTLEMTRKFLTKTARTQGQRIMFFNDPFKLVSVSNIAEIADKMTRNEIMSSNEFRRIIGMKPSDDPAADELRNKNLNQAGGEGNPMMGDSTELVNELNELNAFDTQLNAMEVELNHAEDWSDDDIVSLMHYASPYYDPEYAHRYYEEHKHLKGRHSTAGLNEEGREHAAYAKSNIYKERDSRIASSKSKMESSVNAANKQKDTKLDSLKQDKEAQLESHKNHMNQEIERLKNHLASMDSKSKSVNKESISNQINNLRRENAVQKARLLTQYGIDVGSVKDLNSRAKAQFKTEHAETSDQAKIWAEEQYDKELEKIRNNPSLQKQTKSSSKSSTSVLTDEYKKYGSDIYKNKKK